MDYYKLTDKKPTEIGVISNDIGQTITIFEHPTLGDESELIAVSHGLRLAATTDFFDIDSMKGDYQPRFINGELKYKYECK